MTEKLEKMNYNLNNKRHEARAQSAG
jgi:hypothetical protein